MAQTKSRPLSPHLTIWKWGPHMLLSILHRVTGDGMAVVGGVALVAWLYAAASGPEAYAAFQAHATSWYGYAIMVGLSWAFFQHLLSGIRHLVLDIGAGYELRANRQWSLIVLMLSPVITALFWIILLRGSF
jgi:succinate dehydrogenase / fumarate reductase cytochrome b subunit